MLSSRDQYGLNINKHVQQRSNEGHQMIELQSIPSIESIPKVIPIILMPTASAVSASMFFLPQLCIF